MQPYTCSYLLSITFIYCFCLSVSSLCPSVSPTIHSFIHCAAEGNPIRFDSIRLWYAVSCGCINLCDCELASSQSLRSFLSPTARDAPTQPTAQSGDWLIESGCLQSSTAIKEEERGHRTRLHFWKLGLPFNPLDSSPPTVWSVPKSEMGVGDARKTSMCLSLCPTSFLWHIYIHRGEHWMPAGWCTCNHTDISLPGSNKTSEETGCNCHCYRWGTGNADIKLWNICSRRIFQLDLYLLSDWLATTSCPVGACSLEKPPLHLNHLRGLLPGVPTF